MCSPYTNIQPNKDLGALRRICDKYDNSVPSHDDVVWLNCEIDGTGTVKRSVVVIGMRSNVGKQFQTQCILWFQISKVKFACYTAPSIRAPLVTSGASCSEDMGITRICRNYHLIMS